MLRKIHTEGGSVGSKLAGSSLVRAFEILERRIRVLETEDSDGRPTMEEDRCINPRWQMMVAENGLQVTGYLGSRRR